MRIAGMDGMLWTHLELAPDSLRSAKQPLRQIAATAIPPDALALAHTHDTPVFGDGDGDGEERGTMVTTAERRTIAGVGARDVVWFPSEGPRRTVPTRFRRAVRHGR